ncbi:MAG TPA: dienelactone hydrolase family protein [Nocardioides sp.]|jgi:dienelactone hydrolase|nr:dienelactone hydrolase family protein [Nocardioides sp.]
MSTEPADVPPYLLPFVLPHEPVDPETVEEIDLYLPGTTPAPAVLMVHGGPLRPDLPVRPRDWPAFRGYGALLAQAGIVGAMFEHGFVGEDSLGEARDHIREGLRSVREDPRVDAERLGIWFFSAGALFLGAVLADAPGWDVAATAGTYGMVGDPELGASGWPQATSTAEHSSVPLLLVRPEHDHDWIASANDELLERCRAAGRPVDVIEVPGGHHSFENVDDTDASRDAIRRSIAWWADTLS